MQAFTLPDRDAEGDKLALRLKCRHVTPASLAHSPLPVEIAQQASAVLAKRADQELACEFKALLLHEHDPTRRLQLLHESRLYGQELSSAQGFRTFLRAIVSSLYDGGHHGLADELVNYLIGQPGSLDEQLEVQESSSASRLPGPPTHANIYARSEVQSLASSANEVTWVDGYGLPVDPSFEGEKRKGDREEAEAKKRVLEHIFGGPIVRWNAEDHAAGLYGDPADLGVSGSNTGWVVQRHERLQVHEQQPATRTKRTQSTKNLSQQRIDKSSRQRRQTNNLSRQPALAYSSGELPNHQGGHIPTQTPAYGLYPNAFDLELARMDAQSDPDVPPPPELPGNDSWIDNFDDFIAQPNHDLPAPGPRPSPNQDVGEGEVERRQSARFISSDAPQLSHPPNHVTFPLGNTPDALNDGDQRHISRYLERCEQRESRFIAEREAERDRRKQEKKRRMLRTGSEEELERLARGREEGEH